MVFIIRWSKQQAPTEQMSWRLLFDESAFLKFQSWKSRSDVRLKVSKAFDLFCSHFRNHAHHKHVVFVTTFIATLVV